MRIATGTVRGYDRDDFEDAWARYVSPSPEKHVTNETTKQSPPNAPKNGTGGDGCFTVSLVTRFPGVAGARRRSSENRLGPATVGPGGPDDDLGELK